MDKQQEQNDILQQEQSNQYGSPEYWERRYQNTQGQRFDWLQSFNTLESIIARELQSSKNKLILNIGCGNGEIQDKLYEEGYHNIINCDISHIVIEQMIQVKQEMGYKQMVYQVMDATQMTYPSKQFDLILDKSTLDALLCSDQPFLQSAKMLKEVQRVLKDDGVYLVISYSEPQYRIPHLQSEHLNLTVRIETIKKIDLDGNSVIHYLYICRKKNDKKERSKSWLQKFYAELETIEKEKKMM